MTQQADIKDSIAIIGLGKVGAAVGYLLRSAGYEIVAVAGRTREKLLQNWTYTQGHLAESLAEAASLANCIIITTSDDAISSVCEEICRKGAILPGKKVLHMSGAGSLALLESARRAGAYVASIHPLQSFATVEDAINALPGSTFAITADEAILDWSSQMVLDLQGVPFILNDRDKPLYHAAACLASNYLTTLLHTVETIYQSLGLAPADAIKAFWPLVSGTIHNIEYKGTVKALTGPIARGDAGTVASHLATLGDRFPEFLPLYCVMGTETVALGLEKKSLSRDKAEMILELLKGGFEYGREQNHHNSDP